MNTNEDEIDSNEDEIDSNDYKMTQKKTTTHAIPSFEGISNKGVEKGCYMQVQQQRAN